MQWLDLRDPRGARLRFAVSEGRTYLLVFGLDPSRREWQQLADTFGFKPGGRRSYLLLDATGKSLMLRDYLAIFPHAVKADLPRERVEVPFVSATGTTAAAAPGSAAARVTQSRQPVRPEGAPDLTGRARAAAAASATAPGAIPRPPSLPPPGDRPTTTLQPAAAALTGVVGPAPVAPLSGSPFARLSALARVHAGMTGVDAPVARPAASFGQRTPAAVADTQRAGGPQVGQPDVQRQTQPGMQPGRQAATHADTQPDGESREPVQTSAAAPDPVGEATAPDDAVQDSTAVPHMDSGEARDPVAAVEGGASTSDEPGTVPSSEAASRGAVRAPRTHRDPRSSSQSRTTDSAPQPAEDDVPAPRNSDPDARALASEDGAARYWGRNQNGDKVFEGAFGRYLLREKDGVQVNEADLPAPVYFLRANTVEDIMGCADGFVRAMLIGEVQYQEDVERLAEAMTGSREAGPVNIARSAIEAAMTRALRRDFEVAHDAFDTAVTLYDRLPQARVSARGAAALPLPLAVVAQWLLGDTRGKDVVVPNAYDGALTSVLIAGSHIRAGLTPTLHPAASPAALSPDIEWFGEVYALDAQALLFNADPDVGAAHTVDGVTVRRSDYAQAMAQLSRLDDEGRAVLVLAGDDARAPGLITGEESIAFYGWLARTFSIDAAFETSFELQRRAGTVGALRVIALKKHEPDALQELKRLRVAHDWDVVRDLVRTAIREKGIEEALPEGINVERETAENVLQVPYQAASRLGEARTMVPKNMFGALNEKFAEIEGLYGPVERIVGRGMNLSPAELSERYSPEQQDAIALGMLRTEKDSRGLIIGDETGIGKGRTIAALCSWASQQGRVVIFLTKGTNLFSDLVRDMKDAQVWDDFRPFVVNAEATLIDIMGDRSVLARGTPVETLRGVMAAGTTLQELNCNIVFATYSQFNGKNSQKARWLLDQCERALVVVDEAHEAAGASSNIANFVETLTGRAWGAIYSSATWAKTVDNIGIYRRALPRQVNADTLRDTMRRGGEGFMETFSTMLAREGALIRREHDMSRLEVRVKVDEGRRAQNERTSDQISEVLGAMAFVAGETNRLFTRMNAGVNDVLGRARERRTEIVEVISGDARTRVLDAAESEADQAEALRALRRMKVARLQFNLGNNLYQTIRRVEAAMTAGYTADLAIDAIREGRKPVIVFEDTGETLTRRIVEQTRARMVEAAAREGIPVEDVPKVTEIPTPTVKDMLRSMARSLGVVSWKTGEQLLLEARRGADDEAGAAQAAAAGGESDEDDAVEPGSRLQFIDDIEGLPQDFVENYREGLKRIMEAIDVLPDMPICVPDILLGRLEAEGYRVGEVSGRVVTARDLGDGQSLVVTRNNSKKAVTATVNAFNDGNTDAILINRAGAAGLSLHASPRFVDTRQRELFETQIPNNVSDRIQLFGRVNRYDQLSHPLFTCVSSGLYASLRLLMMQNGKLRKLSANMRSSRNNTFEDTRIPDLLNPVGRDAAHEFLQDNPGMLVRMGLDESVLAEESSRQTDFADIVMKRVPLLRVAEQKRVFEELLGRFDDIVMRAEMRGENPLSAQEINGRVRQGDRRIVSGIEIPGQSIFDAPVYLSEIRWEQEVQPVRWAGVIEQVTGGRARLVEQGVGVFDNRYAAAVSAGGVDVSAYVARVQQMFGALSRIALQATTFETVDAALAAGGLNAVKRTMDRSTWFGDMAPKLLPGAAVQLPGFMGDAKEQYVVTGWSLPARNREINLDQYRIQFSRPGDTNGVEMSLATLMSYREDVEVLSPDLFDPQGGEVATFVSEMLAAQFDNAPGGRLMRSRMILDGNLYAASELAAENKLGSGVLFTDERGVRRRAVLLKSSLSDFDLRNLPRAINRVELLVRIGRAFRQFGADVTIPLHLSLRDAMKRKGSEVLYLAQRDVDFQWQLHIETSEMKRIRDKLRMAGHEGTLGHGIQHKRGGRGRTIIFSPDIELLPVMLEARDIETVFLTRLDHGELHNALDVLEQQYRDEQIVAREEEVGRRQAELARQAREEEERAAVLANALAQAGETDGVTDGVTDLGEAPRAAA